MSIKEFNNICLININERQQLFSGKEMTDFINNIITKNSSYIILMVEDSKQSKI